MCLAMGDRPFYDNFLASVLFGKPGATSWHDDIDIIRQETDKLCSPNGGGGGGVQRRKKQRRNTTARQADVHPKDDAIDRFIAPGLLLQQYYAMRYDLTVYRNEYTAVSDTLTTFMDRLLYAHPGETTSGSIRRDQLFTAAHYAEYRQLLTDLQLVSMWDQQRADTVFLHMAAGTSVTTNAFQVAVVVHADQRRQQTVTTTAAAVLQYATFSPRVNERLAADTTSNSFQVGGPILMMRVAGMDVPFAVDADGMLYPVHELLPSGAKPVTRLMPREVTTAAIPSDATKHQIQRVFARRHRLLEKYHIHVETKFPTVLQQPVFSVVISKEAQTHTYKIGTKRVANQAGFKRVQLLFADPKQQALLGSVTTRYRRRSLPRPQEETSKKDKQETYNPGLRAFQWWAQCAVHMRGENRRFDLYAAIYAFMMGSEIVVTWKDRKADVVRAYIFDSITYERMLSVDASNPNIPGVAVSRFLFTLRKKTKSLSLCFNTVEHTFTHNKRSGQESKQTYRLVPVKCVDKTLSRTKQPPHTKDDLDVSERKTKKKKKRQKRMERPVLQSSSILPVETTNVEVSDEQDGTENKDTLIYIDDHVKFTLQQVVDKAASADMMETDRDVVLTLLWMRIEDWYATQRMDCPSEQYMLAHLIEPKGGGGGGGGHARKEESNVITID
jgi:hypothetical protein